MPKPDFMESEEDTRCPASPSLSPAASGGFRSVGHFAQAVVLRVASGLPSIKFGRVADREEGDDNPR